MTGSSTRLVECKVAVVGPAHAGKTTLIHSLAKKPLNAQSLKPTVQAAVVSGRVGNVHIFFVDTGNNFFSRNTAKTHIDDANYVLLVFDASNRDSFLAAKALHAELGMKSKNCILIGNKNDLNAEIAGPKQDEVSGFKCWKFLSVNQNSTQELADFIVSDFNKTTLASGN